jgi:cytochrome bd ubiquinol oxidase subunit II
MTALQITWFGLIAVLLAGYAILDGFDLGVGIWYLFTKGDERRRKLLRAIGPVWDGNEVWLLTGGGALFAAFPHVYATVFSGLYLALMLVLLALIFRAAAMEFRNGDECPKWRGAWDVGFALGSILPALLFGVALGNILRGLPLNRNMAYTGNFFTLLNPYALLIGVLGLVMLAQHGALYIALKTEGEQAELARGWARKSGYLFLVLLIAAMAVTFATQPLLIANYMDHALLWAVPALVVLCAVFTHRLNEAARAAGAFVASALTVGLMMVMCGVGLFPNLVPALGDPAISLTVANASSSELTLKVMLILALIGVPIVLLYTVWVYRIFGGKVKLDEGGAY